jgi:hypothetical protein
MKDTDLEGKPEDQCPSMMREVIEAGLGAGLSLLLILEDNSAGMVAQSSTLVCN